MLSGPQEKLVLIQQKDCKLKIILSYFTVAKITKIKVLGIRF